LFFFSKLNNTNITSFFNLNNNFFNFTKTDNNKIELTNPNLIKFKPLLNKVLNDTKVFNLNIIFLKFIQFIKNTYYKSFSFSFYYMQAMFFVLFIDACLIDDEPL
jgi:hypothetical protein